MANVKVHMFPALRDNYAFLVHDEATGETAVIDTPEAAAIEKALNDTGWRLTHIFNTHHHADHAGGNLELKREFGCTIVGPHNDYAGIPGIDVAVGEGDEVRLGELHFKVIEVPGHTLDHIAYWCAEAKVAFVGDALFALGCGRLFEGTAQQMWTSLQKLMALPDDTKVYCAHEYTQANARFALTVEPHNDALIARARDIDHLRAESKPTVPTTIGLEKATNPFLRPTSPDLQETIGMTGADPVDVFAETRRRKDAF
jgi:hydroxyacylglutathione hydrolase